MALTRSEFKELESLILTVTDSKGKSAAIMAALVLDVADPPKLRKWLTNYARDIESEDPGTAERLRYFADKVGGRVLSEEKGPMYQRLYRDKYV